MSLPRKHKIQYGRDDFQGFARIFRDLALSKSLRTLTADCVVFGRLDAVYGQVKVTSTATGLVNVPDFSTFIREVNPVQ